MLYGKVGYHDWEGLSVDKDERFRIAENLGENKVLIMRNHGLLTVGEDRRRVVYEYVLRSKNVRSCGSSSKFWFGIKVG